MLAVSHCQPLPGPTAPVFPRQGFEKAPAALGRPAAIASVLGEGECWRVVMGTIRSFPEFLLGTSKCVFWGKD